jgi:hypothetical protein
MTESGTTSEQYRVYYTDSYGRHSKVTDNAGLMRLFALRVNGVRVTSYRKVA